MEPEKRKGEGNSQGTETAWGSRGHQDRKKREVRKRKALGEVEEWKKSGGQGTEKDMDG